MRSSNLAIISMLLLSATAVGSLGCGGNSEEQRVEVPAEGAGRTEAPAEEAARTVVINPQEIAARAPDERFVIDLSREPVVYRLQGDASDFDYNHIFKRITLITPSNEPLSMEDHVARMSESDRQAMLSNPDGVILTNSQAAASKILSSEKGAQRLGDGRDLAAMNAEADGPRPKITITIVINL